MTMPPFNGEKYAKGYVLTEFLWQRCQIFRPVRTVGAGDGQGTGWQWGVGNCPFYHMKAYGFDEPTPVGRQDQVLVFTTERLFFPLKTNIAQDYWLREGTRDADGEKVVDFG